MLNKLKQKLKNRKPMEPKRKALVKGLVFGFLAGGLATITAVGIVGCSMTQGESKQPKMLRADVSYDGTTWTFVDEPSFETEDIEMSFVSSGINFVSFASGYGELGVQAWYRNARGQSMVVYNSDGWATGFQSITLDGEPDTYALTFLQTYAVLEGSASSSAATTSPSSSSSRAEGGAVTFNDRNPFSAWVVNPKSLERATSFDSGAPWLLYTGLPTDDNSNHSTIATKYELYNVGAFHVYGNDGVTFDKSGITTQNLSADNVLTLDGETATQVSAAMYEKGAFRVTGIKYVNSVSNNSVDVYKEAWSVVDMNGNSVYALSGGRWLNEGFRTIVIDDVDGFLTIHGYLASVGWWLENNALASSDAVATMVLGNSSTGVFGLIASAFGCWTSLFGLAIIPGLTIGTLIFVPLVVMIIVAIVKLLAK